MNVIIGIFLILTVLWLCYWTLIRPIILDSVEDELQRMKSNLDWAIINGTAGSQSEAAQILANDLEYPKSIRWISMSQAIITRIFHRSEVTAVGTKECELFESSPPWIREMWAREIRVSVKAALANSPSCWIPLSIVLLISFFSRKVENWWRDTEKTASKLKFEKLHAPA
jgi:hypothetical protein